MPRCLMLERRQQSDCEVVRVLKATGQKSVLYKGRFYKMFDDPDRLVWNDFGVMVL